MSEARKHAAASEGKGRWALSSKTICPICGEKIKRGRDSYACPAPDHQPRHFRCVYPDMDATTGEEPS